MIRPLRVRHRTMMIALAVIVPALFVAGLTARQAVPRIVESPVGQQAASYESFEVVGRDERAWGELPIRTIWLRGPSAAAPRAVSLEVDGPLKRPDLLVYWDDRSSDAGELSDGARLLGRLGGRRHVTWDVPAPSGSGRLVLYSTAWKQVVASAVPPPDWGTAQ
jgi:hypothetical protein